MRRKRRGKGILIFLVLLMLVAAVGFLSTEFFQIRSITAYGQKTISADDISTLSGIPIGENIFKLDKSLAKERIESNPFLKVIDIRRNYPDKVVIEVSERTACAVIPYLGSNIIIDPEGIILGVVDASDGHDYPTITDIYIKSFVVGQPINCGDDYQLKALQRILEEIDKEQIGGEIAEINMKNPDDIYMTSRAGLVIRIGQAIDIPKKLRWLKSQEFIQLNNSDIKGMLDVTIPNKAIYTPIKEENKENKDDGNRGETHE
jgi:cell division protein FtsQ